MKHLGISGGGTKIGGLFGACEYILKEKNYKPDIISGISAGAILSLPLALGKYDRIRELVLDFNLKTFFDNPPVKPSGKVRLLNALGKLIAGRHYLGSQENLEKVLSDVVPESEFDRYKTDNDLAICIVGAVDFYTGKRFYINLKEVEYSQFLKIVNASSSLPVFTPGIDSLAGVNDFEGKQRIHDKILLYDGGVRDHSPTSKILGSNVYTISETCTVFSRSEEINQIIDPDRFEPKNVLTVLEQYIDITNAEVSKNDEILEKELIREKGIRDHGTIWLPKVMHGVYDVDKKRLEQMYSLSAGAAERGWVD